MNKNESYSKAMGKVVFLDVDGTLVDYENRLIDFCGTGN